ncbi:hypothetical protein EVAR_26840_1 [Eumeta japonica]|uniref:Uncharacterized protein n=1 Tax=Eumeta variegata TaxID=151549 RepID=A0A4C1VZB4_EUMVA|nr:hypothetical protein EVAR_26840_1 [Eumeta japonica]
MIFGNEAAVTRARIDVGVRDETDRRTAFVMGIIIGIYLEIEIKIILYGYGQNNMDEFASESSQGVLSKYHLQECNSYRLCVFELAKKRDRVRNCGSRREQLKSRTGIVTSRERAVAPDQCRNLATAAPPAVVCTPTPHRPLPPPPYPAGAVYARRRTAAGRACYI